MNIEQLDTPDLILDKARLVRNINAMTFRTKELGVDLRPHLKTAKSADVARLAVKGNSGGITVGTLENGGVGIAPCHDLASEVSSELASEVEALRKGIISGSIVMNK